jgi:hypothetical protein
MKKETKILKADHDPIKVGDNVLVDVKTKTKKRKKPIGPGPDTNNHLSEYSKPPV